jgi:hydroxymethylglutaryl-CoA lyase
MTASGVRIRDVSFRDGLQLAGGCVPTDDKVRAIRRLLEAGVPLVEVGSMVNPALVPQLADTVDVLRALTPQERERCVVWVATPRGAQRALDAGARTLQYCLSVSDAHNEANVGRSTGASLDALPAVVEQAQAVSADVQLCMATSFTCPIDGAVPRERVIAVASDPRSAGTSAVVVCDTLGQARPDEVNELVGAVADIAQGRELIFHGHDTWGLGVANSLAAVVAGATTLDGSLGGLGGCPFARGASGNTATEDLLFALQPDWLTRESFGIIVEVGERLLADLGEPQRSRAAMGTRGDARGFPWSLGPRDVTHHP